MKRVLIIAIMFISISMTAQDTIVQAPKWRALTFQLMDATNFNNQEILQFSVALDYELKNDYSISSWNGISYTRPNDSSWIASVTTIDKRMGGFTVGLGVMYNDWQESIANIIEPTEENWYAVLKLRYTLKL
jgi:hypothetical protein